MHIEQRGLPDVIIGHKVFYGTERSSSLNFTKENRMRRASCLLCAQKTKGTYQSPSVIEILKVMLNIILKGFFQICGA